MKIIVVDDHIQAEDAVRAALASDPSMEQHSVKGARTPDELERIDDLGTFGLAFVDLDFRRQSDKSGLFALRVLEHAGVLTVIYAADDEDNRALLLLAAFQFYEPLALVSKGASNAEIRKIVITIDSGARPDCPAMQRYQRPRRGKSIIDRLIIRASDLAIWKALATQSDRNAIAEAVPVSASKVDDFLREHYDIVEEIKETFLFRTPPEPPPAARPTRTRAGQAYAHRLAPLHSFAVEHHHFFRDAEVERLIKQQGDMRLSPPPGRGPSRRRR
jgi:hypothetical protein